MRDPRFGDVLFSPRFDTYLVDPATGRVSRSSRSHRANDGHVAVLLFMGTVPKGTTFDVRDVLGAMGYFKATRVGWAIRLLWRKLCELLRGTVSTSSRT